VSLPLREYSFFFAIVTIKGFVGFENPVLIRCLVYILVKLIISASRPRATRSLYLSALFMLSILSRYLQNCHTTPAPERFLFG